MLNELELKTFIPAIVAPCVLLYESYTGNHVSESTQAALTNGILIGVGFAVSLWGAYRSHQKKPPDVKTPSIQEVNIEKKEVFTPSINPVNNPIVTQEDLNKKIGG
jgi:hypothetical protein